MKRKRIWKYIYILSNDKNLNEIYFKYKERNKRLEKENN